MHPLMIIEKNVLLLKKLKNEMTEERIKNIKLSTAA
jgi:hypothetical protein